MRILLVNPNTSAGVTACIDGAAQSLATPGDRFITVNPAFGPALIVTEADAAEATRGVLETLKGFRDPVDGIVLASFGDTGADAVRAAHPGLPVVGLAGAALAAARALGGSPAIVTFARPVIPGLRTMAERHGLAPRLFNIVSLPLDDAGDPGRVQQAYGADLTDLVRDTVQAGATSIIMGGGPLAGFAADVRNSVNVPVIDGVQAAIGVIRSSENANQPNSNLELTR